MQIKFKKSAWFSSPEDLVGLDFSAQEAVSRRLSLTELGIDMSDCGWVRAGEVESVLTLTSDHRARTQEAVEAIEQKITEIRAEMSVKLTKLEGLKQSLLAIELSHD